MKQDWDPKVLAAFDTILDTFGGVDGGRSFICLMQLIGILDGAAKAGDPRAKQALEPIIKVQKLIEYANEKSTNPST